MRIGKISSSAEYRMDEQFQNLTIFGVKFWFSKFKKFYKFSNIFNFQISEYSQFLKFQKVPIRKILQLSKISQF